MGGGSQLNPPTTTEFTPTQYHIQDDVGDRRFFKYQTWGGQIRKENRLDDGSVVGTYGWVDANGLLRLYDYIADNKGYRIVKTRLIKVGKQGLEGNPEIEAALQTTQQTPIVRKKTKLPVDNLIPEDSPRIVELSTPNVDIFEQRRNQFVDEVTPSSARLQRKIFTQGGDSVTVDVVPIFDIESLPGNQGEEVRTTNSLSTNTPTFAEPSVLTEPSSLSASSSLYLSSASTFASRGTGELAHLGPHAVARNRAEDGRQFVVVKRRRGHKLPQPYVGSATLDYQTQRAFHNEEATRDGQRSGQFGYIDPIGVRRVVNYSTGPNGEIVKTKENDFVGAETYFEAS